MLSRLPAFDASDSAAVLARSALGDYTGADLLGAWAALSPAYRPRVSSVDDVRDLVGNGLFERSLRQEARAHDAGAAEVAVALARERERIAVNHLMARDVHGAIAPDTLAVRRWFAAHAREFTLPARWRVVRLVLGDRASATSMALALRDPAAAESLVARGQRQGVAYRMEVAKDRDSLAFARAAAAGAGTVTGPDPEGADWAVMRVEALLPARVLDWREAEAAAWERWYEERESERLAAVLARERKRSPVAIEEPTLHAVLAPVVAPVTDPTSGNTGR
jgi:hypothetical protein